MEKKKKKLLIIILLALLLTSVIIVGTILLVRRGNNTQANTQEETTQTITLPEYESTDSATAFAAMLTAAKEWASDVKVVTCYGSVYPYTKDSLTYYIGGTDGKSPAWGCVIYSKKLKQDTTVSWERGTVSVKEAYTTWGIAKYEEDPDARDFFTLTDFLNSKDIYDILISSGLDFKNDYITYNLGMYNALDLYGDKPVWQINEYSRSVLDDPTNTYSQGKMVKIYYLNASDGSLLKMENL